MFVFVYVDDVLTILHVRYACECIQCQPMSAFNMRRKRIPCFDYFDLLWDDSYFLSFPREKRDRINLFKLSAICKMV